MFLVHGIGAEYVVSPMVDKAATKSTLLVGQPYGKSKFTMAFSSCQNRCDRPASLARLGDHAGVDSTVLGNIQQVATVGAVYQWLRELL